MRHAPPYRSARGGRPRGRPKGHEEEDEIPEVYREMLAEAEFRSPDVSDADRPIKKRKVGAQRATTSDVVSVPQIPLPKEDQGQASRQIQTVYDEPTSEESDMEWEEVDLLQTPAQSIQIGPVTTRGDDESLQITLDNHEGKRRKVISRQKPLTAAEKKLRLDIHKVHVLCLLRHVQIRNLWCNDDELQSFLKRMLPKQVIAMLNPPEDKPQYSRSTTFVEGLNQASDAFSRRFRVNRPGLKRAHWVDDPEKLKQKAESIMSDAEVFLSKEDFCKQARTMQGSRDFGAQLFCALLRSAAVEARLVCSLQPLPFSGTTKSMTPNKPNSQYIVISSDNHDTSADDQQTSGLSPTPPSRSRRLGRPQFTPARPPKTSVPGPRFTTRVSPYPVFWVEAFNEAVQKWVPVDPLVTKSIAKPSKFEPPFSDPSNCMCYVVGFEEDASARDVTRRYVKAFNAKTRKMRVESTKDGERWWTRTTRLYEKPFLEDRDELEISELTAKTAAEPMPRNVQDFKDHPIYAIERQLRRNEVVFPKRVIGQVGLGKSGSKDQVLVPVYRRSDVHVVRSADKWYRLGRDIKIGEPPLKHIRANRNKDVGFSEDEHDNESGVEIPLYAYFQTEIYTPPPVVQGKVPKNSYGNLDVYVPSMVPPGGVHIKHPQAAHAARVLGVDYADAVTGFDFKGRHGTAVIQGVVVASEYREALEEVLNCLEDERRQAESEERSTEMLRLWKHFLLKLRIAERVKRYAIEGEESASESSEGYENQEEAGGGFLPEPEQEMADAGKFSTYQRSTEQEPRDYTLNEASTNDSARGDESQGDGFKADKSANHIEAISQNTSEIDIAKASRRSRYSLIVVPNKKANSNENGTSQQQPEQSPEIVELDPAAEAESVKSSGQTGPAGSSQAPIIVDSSTAGGSKSTSVEILSRAASQTQSRAHTPEEMDEISEADDNGSLLSHDPEDEDAIPEWLIDFVTPRTQNAESDDDDDNLDYIDDAAQDNNPDSRQVIEIDDNSDGDASYQPTSHTRARRTGGAKQRPDAARNASGLRRGTNQAGPAEKRPGRKSIESVKGNKKRTEKQQKDKTLTQMDYVRRYLKIEPDDEVKLEYTYITPKKNDNQKFKAKLPRGLESAPTEYASAQESLSSSKKRKLEAEEDMKEVLSSTSTPEKKILKGSPYTPRKPRKSEIPSSQSPESPGVAIISSSQFRNATRSPPNINSSTKPTPTIKEESPSLDQTEIITRQVSMVEDQLSSSMMPDSALSSQLAVDDETTFDGEETQSNSAKGPSASASELEEKPEPDKPPPSTERTVVYETDAETDYSDDEPIVSGPHDEPNAVVFEDQADEDEDRSPLNDSQDLPPPIMHPGLEDEPGPLQSETNLSSEASILYQRRHPATQFPLEPIPTLSTQKLAELFPQESSIQQTMTETSCTKSSAHKVQALSDPSFQTQTQSQTQDLDKYSTEMIPESSPVARHGDYASTGDPLLPQNRAQSVVQVESSQIVDRLKRQADPDEDSRPRGMLSRSQLLTSSVMESVPVPGFWMGSQDSVGEPYSLTDT
ncbi:putative DNA repair protein Rad4 [Aspergillus thermomutatus]|uniref:Uncharacterized protein n=1 Tax=Aspergillus thermomutatus TaxID=41047 RepID=A0A397HAV9_ASPTH|nr:uncharacterized protein CDV56_106040 [Aspergillus thermomutatus]RHZ58523.1 hypothetical protein CDV56_106040 [Aspergillus thermomutatus]